MEQLIFSPKSCLRMIRQSRHLAFMSSTHVHICAPIVKGKNIDDCCPSHSNSGINFLANKKSSIPKSHLS